MVVPWILLSHFAQAQGSSSPHLFGRDDTCPEHRSTADIFWSCLATTFLCTWVTVHPNVPPQGEPLLVSTLRRLHIMIWALLCPEIVLAWAARQWIAAKKIHEAFEHKGWTMAHAFCLVMGGFTLHRDDEELCVLYPEQFQQLYESGDIIFPNVKPGELDDRSKADVVAKIVVIIQCFSFAFQAISRVAYGLSITALELGAIALCVFCAFMLYFWWHKPMDMGFPIPVFLAPTSTYVPPRKGEKKEGKKIQDNEASLPTPPKEEPQSDGPLLQGMAEDKPTTFRQFLKDRRQELKEEYPPLVLTKWIFWPTKKVLMALYGMSQGWTSAETDLGSKTVPTFYSPACSRKEEHKVAYVFLACATIFGGIHCAGWNFDVTEKERLVWRIGCLCLVGIPPATLVLDYIGQLRFGKDPSEALWWPGTAWYDHILNAICWFLLSLAGLIMPVYIFARICLLVESLYVLRSLPESVTLEVPWADYLPQI